MIKIIHHDDDDDDDDDGSGGRERWLVTDVVGVYGTTTTAVNDDDDDDDDAWVCKVTHVRARGDRVRAVPHQWVRSRYALDDDGAELRGDEDVSMDQRRGGDDWARGSY